MRTRWQWGGSCARSREMQDDRPYGLAMILRDYLASCQNSNASSPSRASGSSPSTAPRACRSREAAGHRVSRNRRGFYSSSSSESGGLTPGGSPPNLRRTVVLSARPRPWRWRTKVAAKTAVGAAGSTASESSSCQTMEASSTSKQVIFAEKLSFSGPRLNIAAPRARAAEYLCPRFPT
jgi:hypothetical protein